MATATLTNYADFLTELMVREQLLFGFENVLYAQLAGLQRGENGEITRDPNQERFTRAMDGSREVFHGKQITIPLQLNDVPGAAAIAEGATWPVTAAIDSNQATLKLKSLIQPIALTLEVERDAKDGSTSAMDVIEKYTASAYRQLARVENDFMHGAGDALLAKITVAGASGLVHTVGTGANFDQLTPGRVVDFRVASTGVAITGGKRRKIASVSRADGTVTIDTAAVASDGDSGNFATATTDGIFIDSSAGNAPAGLGQAVADTGTFEGVNKATVQQWQGRLVDANAAVLSDASLDEITYLLRGQGVGASDFGIAHPKTVDPYKASKSSLVRLEMQEKMVRSGFKGIVYQGADQEIPILKDLASPRKVCRLVYLPALRLYGDAVGPEFIQDDGGMFRFFARKTEKEADLFDRLQLGVRACNQLGEINDLGE